MAVSFWRLKLSTVAEACRLQTCQCLEVVLMDDDGLQKTRCMSFTVILYTHFTAFGRLLDLVALLANRVCARFLQIANSTENTSSPILQDLSCPDHKPLPFWSLFEFARNKYKPQSDRAYRQAAFPATLTNPPQRDVFPPIYH